MMSYYIVRHHLKIPDFGQASAAAAAATSQKRPFAAGWSYFGFLVHDIWWYINTIIYIYILSLYIVFNISDHDMPVQGSPVCFFGGRRRVCSGLHLGSRKDNDRVRTSPTPGRPATLATPSMASTPTSACTQWLKFSWFVYGKSMCYVGRVKKMRPRKPTYFWSCASWFDHVWSFKKVCILY